MSELAIRSSWADPLCAWRIEPYQDAVGLVSRTVRLCAGASNRAEEVKRRGRAVLQAQAEDLPTREMYL